MTASTAFRLWPIRILMTAGIVVLLLVLQRTLPGMAGPYVTDIIIRAGINVILAVSLNLINGITGQFSLGHAGFMAVGAYSAAAFTYYGGPRLVFSEGPIFVIALLIAAVTAGLAGWLVGLPSLRLRGDYLAIVTLGFGQIIIAIIRTIEEVGGALGLNNVPGLTSFAWVYALVILCLLCVRNLADSGLGRSMRAVRDDEVAAEAVGVNTTQIKVLAFVISAMWAGMAGALQVHYIKLAQPESFDFIRSVEIVVMVVLGGLGSITGATVAAVLLTFLAEALRSINWAFAVMLMLPLLAAVLSFPRYRAELHRGQWSGGAGWSGRLSGRIVLIALFYFGHQWLEDRVSQLRYVIYALILIVLMLLRPQGLLGRSEFSWGLLRRRRETNIQADDMDAGRAAGELSHAQSESADQGVEGTLK
jgi:branched-chain amino acid transport system permease protein